MKTIGLIDFGKIPNLALMRTASYHKAQGDTVILLSPKERRRNIDKVYCSVVFQKDKGKAEALREVYGNIEFGGPGWSLETVLPEAIAKMKPDYGLYSAEYLYGRIAGCMSRESKLLKAQILANAGIGFTSRGCIRKCSFCIIPKAKYEGKFRQEAEIKDLISPKSNVCIILDNNFMADPLFFDKVTEIKERKLVVDITQGLDMRLMTPEKAEALSSINHLRSIHYAWDNVKDESIILKAVNMLSKFINVRNHRCFILCGFNTTFNEDMFRFRKLKECGVLPYVMVFNSTKDLRLQHFARWGNAPGIHKKCSFEDYLPWCKIKEDYFRLPLFAAA